MHEVSPLQELATGPKPHRSGTGAMPCICLHCLLSTPIKLTNPRAVRTAWDRCEATNARRTPACPLPGEELGQKNPTRGGTMAKKPKMKFKKGPPPKKMAKGGVLDEGLVKPLEKSYGGTVKMIGDIRNAKNKMPRAIRDAFPKF